MERAMTTNQLSNLKTAAYHIEQAASSLIAANQESIVDDFSPILAKMTDAMKVRVSDEWVSVFVTAGRAANGKRLEPRPAGPYLVTDQTDQTDYAGLTIEKVIESYRDKLRNDFTETLGTVVYAFGSDQKLSKCFYFYDTSD